MLTDKMRMVVLMALTTLCMSVSAQSEPEYLMEIGSALGLTSYQGDFSHGLFKGMSPTVSGTWRRLINPRQGFKVEMSAAKISGSSLNVDTYYPGILTGGPSDEGAAEYTFGRGLFDLNGVYEQNFWPYGTGKEYRGAKRLTPYMFAGFGFTLATGDPKTAFTANVPLGVGVKYKLGDRLNLDINWAMHFSMSDMLDGMKDPYMVESSGLFKNTDCYSTLKVGLTYSFKEKCRVCHNADE